MGAMGEIAVNAFILAKEKSAILYLEDCLWQNQTNKQQPEGSSLWLDVYSNALVCVYLCFSSSAIWFSL